MKKENMGRPEDIPVVVKMCEAFYKEITYCPICGCDRFTGDSKISTVNDKINLKEKRNKLACGHAYYLTHIMFGVDSQGSKIIDYGVVIKERDYIKLRYKQLNLKQGE